MRKLCNIADCLLSFQRKTHKNLLHENLIEKNGKLTQLLERAIHY